MPPIPLDATTPDLTSLTFTLIGVLLGAAIAAIATWRAARIGAFTAFEGEKYRQRLTAYQALWSHTQTLRRTPEPQDMTIAAMINTIDRLDEWYFTTGGLLLTDDARAAYFELVDAMQSVQGSAGPDVSPDLYKSIFAAATKLRDITATEVRGKSKTFRADRNRVSTTPNAI